MRNVIVQRRDIEFVVKGSYVNLVKIARISETRANMIEGCRIRFSLHQNIGLMLRGGKLFRTPDFDGADHSGRRSYSG